MKNSRRRYSFPYRNRTGSVLILTIWVLVFFSILSVGLYSIVSGYIRIFRRIEDNIVGRYLAEGACADARIQRKLDKTAYDTLYELRQEKEAELQLCGEFIYRLVDEESKININSAPKTVLTRLSGIEDKTADRILSSNLRPFQAKEELLLIEGVKEEDYEKFKDYITVYTDGAVNINTASRQTLELLGMTESLARSVEEFRKGPDGKEGTEDDEAFMNTGGIVAQLRDYISFSAAEEAILVQLISQNLLTVSSANFTLDCETKILGRAGRKYAIVFNSKEIRRWQEL